MIDVDPYQNRNELPMNKYLWFDKSATYRAYTPCALPVRIAVF